VQDIFDQLERRWGLYQEAKRQRRPDIFYGVEDQN
jgi:hypothetical protein